MRYHEPVRHPSLVVAAIAALTLTSCTDLDDLAQGTSGEDSPFHNGVRGPAAVGAKVTWGGMDLCIRDQPVTITGIRFTSPGVRVVESRIYDRTASSARVGGGGPALLPGGRPAVGTTITTRCSPNPPPVTPELEVLVQRLDPQELSGYVVIDYENARGDDRSLEYSVVSFGFMPI